MLKKTVFAIVALFTFFISNTNAQVFNIKDYGAVTDSKTVNTGSIQKAIDKCSAGGGGTVYVPAGVFITGTFNLKSNINLHLESGAVLKGSSNIKDYRSYTIDGYGLNYYGLIYTERAANVSITGLGTIDGTNEAFLDFSKAKRIDQESSKLTRQKENFRHVANGIGDGPVTPAKDRPHQMLIFSECKNVRISNVSLINSPFWTVHFAYCDVVHVNGIKLWSGLLVPNADGIDVTSCTNVIIDNCDIRAGDDAIAIVGYDHHFELPGFKNLKHLSENIIVTNCNLQSNSSAIRVGFLDQNSVRNVQVSHVNITNSNRGIGIFVRDEGSLENISFSDMNIETHLRTGDWWGNGEPIHISAVPGKEGITLGKIKDVDFTNIKCAGENGILMFGSPEGAIQDVRFNNVSLKINNSQLNDVAGGNIDMRGALLPQDQLFTHDLPGFYAHSVKSLSITNFRLEWDPSIKHSFFTSGFEVENFSNLKMFHITGASSPANSGLKTLVLRNGSDVTTDMKSVTSSKVTGIKFKSFSY